MVEFDIKAAFDQIDHSLLLKAVRTHIREGWILLYIERWLTAPFETAEGEQLPRERGTPQGGVVSPILMNLFMHYTFDAWMKRTNPLCCHRSSENVVFRVSAGIRQLDIIRAAGAIIGRSSLGRLEVVRCFGEKADIEEPRC